MAWSNRWLIGQQLVFTPVFAARGKVVDQYGTAGFTKHQTTCWVRVGLILHKLILSHPR